ncbi:permease [bacterium]|nr:permease [candidate division CSSED10-310 bacterium]
MRVFKLLWISIGLCFALIGPVTLEIVTRSREELTFHMWIGRCLALLFVLLIIYRLLGEWARASRVGVLVNAVNDGLSDWIKSSIMALAGVASLGTYIYCHHVCQERSATLEESLVFSHRIFSLTLSIGSIFICACILSAIIFKVTPRLQRRLPTGMLSGGIFAALLPTCACGSIPIAKGMMETDRIPLRTVITFIMVAPVLNPYLIIFSLQLGWPYTVLRVVGIFALAMLTGLFIQKWLAGRINRQVEEDGLMNCTGCSGGLHGSSNLLVTSWNLFFSLLPYFAAGILIGGFAAELLPQAELTAYFTSDFLGLFLVTAISLPLFLCAGQEIMLLFPFMDIGCGQMPLPLGHGLAFTFAGTGICISSIPLLYKVLGKKMTIAVIFSFFFGSILLGYLVNIGSHFFS